MYFITGGAFHGKGRFVQQHFQVDKPSNQWFSYFHENQLTLDGYSDSVLVIEGLEQLVANVVKQDATSAREVLSMLLEKWLDFEREAPGRSVVLIGTDVGKGIVPMERELRDIRDMTGWFYQEIVQRAAAVQLIWYGLAQTLK
ncbi:hypothetical protein A374_02339 [Fictibacillus macauensis ZFHKF-1]|uniref:Uncharacterized protein n=1 Tax=Fictibacillus macauensis ZFHKF-1 TaxID=1196324 RepID=I8UJK4_9BACL|nr:bifunctional adenosylcobinamide kinase/adenosylcobinamide-phosphate guanylyltransferase [Fictibacillus macauensis]EIT87055.1 hypothetical protein A374_02339 [Fictibacillus macauensis ZFHKF-1]